MAWVIQGYRRYGRPAVVEWMDLPDSISDERIARGVGARGSARSGAWPVSQRLADDLEAETGRMLFLRRRGIRRLDYYLEYVADA